VVGNENASRVACTAGILVSMNQYIIGAGAILTAGPTASITPATLHAQTEASLAEAVRAGLVDFESSSLADLSKLVVFATGWSGHDVRDRLISPLVERRVCSLADVLGALGAAANASEVHIFARWLPDETMAATLAQLGITLVAHPLEAVRQAALVCARGFTRLSAPVRAA
jgi:hypothetical protein